MKTIKDFDFSNKRVLVRCDLDVPLNKDGFIVDDFRIRNALPTIQYLLTKGAKVILMSHLDRPQGKTVETLRLTAVQKVLEKLLGLPITKLSDCVGEEVENSVLKMKAGSIVLLENLRFHAEEERNDVIFAKNLCRLGEIYINDAFATSHREHTSIALLPHYLPSGAGFALEKEVKILSKILDNPWRPLVVIIGGVKIESKLDVIEQFLKKADNLLLGGKVANYILQAKGIIVGKPFPEKSILERMANIDLTNPKLHLPVDGLISLAEGKENYFRIGGIGSVRKEESVFDIGSETIKVFSNIIKSARMILWVGPMGMFEDKKFETGTKEIASAIVRNHMAFKIAGGGDTIGALKRFNLINKFDYICSGGGAMLEFLAGRKLPGLVALGIQK